MDVLFKPFPENEPENYDINILVIQEFGGDIHYAFRYWDGWKFWDEKITPGAKVLAFTDTNPKNIIKP